MYFNNSIIFEQSVSFSIRDSIVNYVHFKDKEYDSILIDLNYKGQIVDRFVVKK